MLVNAGIQAIRTNTNDTKHTDNDDDDDNDDDNDDDIKEKNIKKKFSKPTIDEIREYCQERNNNVNPEQFYDHYETNGWKRGKTAIKDWKACVRTWERNDTQENSDTLKMREF